MLGITCENLLRAQFFPFKLSHFYFSHMAERNIFLRQRLIQNAPQSQVTYGIYEFCHVTTLYAPRELNCVGIKLYNKLKRECRKLFSLLKTKIKAAYV